VDAVAEMVAADTGVTIVDVREPHEFAEAHAAGAIPIPLGQIISRRDELPDGPLHMICRSGGRSMEACEALAPLGYDVTNVAGGTLAWIEAGHPVSGGSAT